MLQLRVSHCLYYQATAYNLYLSVWISKGLCHAIQCGDSYTRSFDLLNLYIDRLEQPLSYNPCPCECGSEHESANPASIIYSYC